MGTLISFAKGLGILVIAVLAGIILIGIIRILIVWRKEGWHGVKCDRMLGELLRLEASIVIHGIAFFIDRIWSYLKGLNTRMRSRQVNNTDLCFITGTLSFIVIIIACFMGFNNPAFGHPLAQFVFSWGTLILMIWALLIRYSMPFNIRSKGRQS